MGFYEDEMKKYGRKPESRFSGHSPGYKKRKEREESREETEEFNAGKELGVENPIDEEIFKDMYSNTRELENFDEKGSCEVICEELREKGFRGTGAKRILNKEIWDARDAGLTYVEIAEETGCNKMTVYRHLHLYHRL